MLLLLVHAGASGREGKEATAETAVAAAEPQWTRDLTGRGCPWSDADSNCHYASPAVADVTGDGQLEIVVATNNGHVAVVDRNGELLWQRDYAAAFGMSPGTQQFASSPAVADLDADGSIEIVVGAGTQFGNICTQGGVIVIAADGSVKPGWPFLTQDVAVPPAGCRDSVFSTPALGDLDRDGDLEIVFGSFDKRLYALHHDGRSLNGFPADSYLLDRFPDWDNLISRFADTIWSSPALGDLDGDGFLDIVIGTDEGNFDNTWGGDARGWSCPYAQPGAPGYCGGSLYALDRFGNSLPGFPVYLLETIQSTPALMDVNGDGRSEIFVGTGSYYRQASPDNPTSGFRFYAFDGQGRPLPGWEGGQPTGETVPAAPVVGDINGDGQPEVVVAARDKQLYAWRLSGQTVPGFPMTPRTHFGQVIDNYDIPTSFVLADYTGDGRMEILFNNAAEVVVVDGNGDQLTATGSEDTRPFYYTGNSLLNTPAVVDLDGNGRLDLIVSNSRLTVWELPDSSTAAAWPMFKHDPWRTGAVVQPRLEATPQSITLLHTAGESGRAARTLQLNVGPTRFQWSLRTDRSEQVTLEPASGVAVNSVRANVTLLLPPDLQPGSYAWATITASVEADNATVANTPLTIPVQLRVVETLYRSYVPLARR